MAESSGITGEATGAGCVTDWRPASGQRVHLVAFGPTLHPLRGCRFSLGRQGAPSPPRTLSYGLHALQLPFSRVRMVRGTRQRPPNARCQGDAGRGGATCFMHESHGRGPESATLLANEESRTPDPAHGKGDNTMKAVSHCVIGLF